MLFEPSTYSNDKALAEAIWDFKKRSEAVYDVLRKTVWPLCKRFYHSKHDPTLFARWARKAGTEHPFDVLGGEGIFDPVPFYQIEAKVPPIYEAVFGEGDLPFLCQPYPQDFRFEDERTGTLWLHAEERQRLLTSQWYGFLKMDLLGNPLLRDVFLYGAVPLLFEWSVTREPGWAQRTDKEGKWGFRTADNYQMRRGVKCTPIPLADFFPDERGRSLDGLTGQPCEAAAVRYMLTLDKLVSWVLATPLLKWNIPKAARQGRDALRAWFKEQGVIGSVTPDDDWPAQMQYEVGRRSGLPTTASSRDDQRVLLLRYYEGGDDPRHIMIAGRDGNGPVLLHQSGAEHPARNAGIPIALVQSMPILHELFGLSTIEEIAFLAAYNNLLINLDLSNRVRSVNGVTLLNPLSGLSAARMASQPGGVWEVNPMVSLDAALKRVDIPFVSSDIQQVVAQLRQQMHVTAGGVDPLLGFPSGETARAAMIATEQGSRRWGAEAKVVRNCLTRCGEIMDAINMQHITSAIHFQEVGKHGPESLQPIGPQAFTNRVQVFLDSRVLVTNPAAQAQAMTNFAATWVSVPGTDLNRLRTEHAKALRLPDPGGFGMSRQNRQDIENELFRESIQAGDPRFGEVSQTDKHWEHWQAHWDVEQEARAAGQGALNEFVAHQQTHQRLGGFDGAEQPHRPQLAPEGQPGMPGVPGMEGGAGGAPGVGPDGMPLESAPGMNQFANAAAQTPALAPRG